MEQSGTKALDNLCKKDGLLSLLKVLLFFGSP
jgi:hypothetical protein